MDLSPADQRHIKETFAEIASLIAKAKFALAPPLSAVPIIPMKRGKRNPYVRWRSDEVKELRRLITLHDGKLDPISEDLKKYTNRFELRQVRSKIHNERKAQVKLGKPLLDSDAVLFGGLMRKSGLVGEQDDASEEEVEEGIVPPSKKRREHDEIDSAVSAAKQAAQQAN